MLTNHRVLVLNSSYEAINICTAKRAVVMMFSGKADILEECGQQIHSTSVTLPLPEVIRLRRFIKLPYRPVPFCRKNIILRDGFTCQYCHERSSADQLTLDHVIPQSRGGKDSWSNIVTACKKCNHKKGNYLLEEIGMVLNKRPKKPSLPSFLHLVRLMGEERIGWRKYLYFGDDLDDDSIDQVETKAAV